MMHPNKRFKQDRKMIINSFSLKNFILVFFISFLFNCFSVISAKENILKRSVTSDECPVCFDQDMLESLNKNCPSISSVVDIDELTDEERSCLCNESRENSNIEKCQLCIGLTSEEFQQRCLDIADFDMNKNVYINNDMIDSIDNKVNDNLDNGNSSESPSNNKKIIFYGGLGGGGLIIMVTGFFIVKKLNSDHNGPSNELQMEHVQDFNHLNDINVDNYYRNKNNIMPLEPSMSNKRVSNHHYNGREEMYQLPYASTSSSEPNLNDNIEPQMNSLGNYNRIISSAPNIPARGILVNRGSDINKSRKSSLGHDSISNKGGSQKSNKPHVTFSKGLTTMHEFMSKADECEGLKRESLVNLGWHHGVVIHNFKPNKEDEIKLRIGDNVIIRLAFDDGWAYAFNRNTGVVGMIPLICVKPAKSVRN